jgi:hypothetical protein
MIKPMKKWIFHIFGSRKASGTADISLRNIKVSAPHTYFERTTAFIDDLYYFAKDSSMPSTKMTITFIIRILFDNFVDQVRKEMMTYDHLLELRDTYGNVLYGRPHSQTISYVAASAPHHPYSKKSTRVDGNPAMKFQWTLSHDARHSVRSDNRYKTLNVPLDDSKVRRVQTLFSDFEARGEDIYMDMDELVSLLYYQFVDHIRNNIHLEAKQSLIHDMVKEWKLLQGEEEDVEVEDDDSKWRDEDD